MYQNNKKKNKIILMIFLATSLLFILLSIILYKDEQKLGIAESYLKDTFLFINKVAVAPFNRLKSNNCNYIDNYSYDEELEYQIAQLKDTLELNNLLNERVMTNAVMINRNLGYWYDTMTVDKGSDDGIEPGMPVVVKNGLIGKVITVSPESSVIRLLTSKSNNKISVKVETNDYYAYGLLTSFNDDNKTYRIEGISQTISIKGDATVTTTGLGDIFPSGILIGRVANITSDSYDLSQIIEVSPSVNFDSIDIVTILKRNAK